jgi:hypothetical protein
MINKLKKQEELQNINNFKIKIYKLINKIVQFKEQILIRIFKFKNKQI